MRPAPERLKVRFCPQDWVGGVATATSAPELVDVTDQVLQMRAEEIAALRDGRPEASALIDPVARGHFGPYSVLCEADICVFFRINNITELTQEVLDTRRCGLTPKGQVLAHEVEAGGSVWMLGVGPDKLHFAVRADDIDHAISECRETFPGNRCCPSAASPERISLSFLFLCKPGLAPGFFHPRSPKGLVYAPKATRCERRRGGVPHK